MALVESLLTAIVRADGDALVMHVGERPYVVAPAGPIELSTQGLNLQAMAGMTAQLLPPDAQRTLTEFGAVEHELATNPDTHRDRFTVVVARGGDDVWIEIRRHRPTVEVASVVAPSVEAAIPESVEQTTPQVAVASPEVGQTATEEHTPSVYTSSAYEDAPAATSVAVHDIVAADTEHASPSASEVEASIDAMASSEPALEAETEVIPATESVPAMASASGRSAELEYVSTAASATAEAHAAYAEPASVRESQVETAEEAAVEVASAPAQPAEEVLVEAPLTVEAVLAPAASVEVAAEAAAEPALEPEADVPSEPASLPAYQLADGVETQSELETEPVSSPEPQRIPAAETVTANPSHRPDVVIAAAVATPMPAAVIPMTRTLRIEVPPPPPQPAALEIERLLGVAASRGATALYLTTQSSPYIRVDADVHLLDGEPPLSAKDVEAVVLELIPDSAREAFLRGEPTEWQSELAEIGPIRCTTFRDHRGPGAILQLVSMRPIAADRLGLAKEIQALATEIEGLVLVAAPRANGKTTVVGSLVDLINRERPTYVITLEKQIRVIHDHRSALISQREVRGTKEELLTVARSAVRENPDVLVIEDMSSAEMVQLALDAAGSGVLVIASITAGSTTNALSRVVDLFPPDKRRGIQALLAERLRGAVSQVLLRKTGGGRVAAREVLLGTASVAGAIGDGQLDALVHAMEHGRKHGLISLTESLVQLVRTGTIDLREAYRKTDDRDALVAALKRENLETSFLERLA
jgi:twitching motility protein PilT